MTKSVIHILHTIGFSGAEKMLYLSSSLFQQKGFELNALSTDEEIGNFAPMLEKTGYKIFHLPGSNKFSHFVSFYKLLKKHRFDIVHDHTEHKSFWYLLCCWLAGTKCIIRTIHSNYTLNWPARIKRGIYRHVGKIVFHVKYTSIGPSVEAIEKKYFLNKTIRVSNWIDDEKYFPATRKEKETKRNELGIDAKKKVIISVGACIEVKNHEAIIEAVSILKERGIDILYLHIGNGDLHDQEKKYAESLGMMSHIWFLGQRENVRDYLVSSDVFVMSSKREGLSISLLEALSCGIPSVVYNSYGLIDLIVHEGNGYVSENTSISLAHFIEKLLSNSVLHSEMSVQARKFVLDNYNMEKSVDKFIELYRK